MFYSRRVASVSSAMIAAQVLTSKPRTAEAQEVAVVKELPRDLLERPAQVTVYQYESCPFCRKVRSVLDYARIPYKIVEVHPLTKTETKSFAADYGKVPILRVDDIQIRDSSRIVEQVLQLVDARLVAAAAAGGGGGGETLRRPRWVGEEEREKREDAESEWVKWVDEYLVQLVVMNIYRNMREAQQTFSYLLTHKEFSFFSKWAVYWSGVLVMRMVAGKRREKFKVEAGDERRKLYEAMSMMVKEGLEEMEKPFIGGVRPNKADFNVYGVIRSTEGFDTQKDLFENVPEVKVWYNKMQAVCGSSMAVNHENAGIRGDVNLARN
jgi:microsomal prostaglandin-E synthase 2